jgi:hypothetical protein
MGIRFSQQLQAVPLMAPATLADGDFGHVRLKNMQWLSFLINWAAITNDTDNIVFKVYSTTCEDGSTNSADVALPFWYRLSAAVGGDNWGDVTYVSTGSDGATVVGTQDNMALIIDVDPAIIPSKDADATHVYIDIDVTITSTDTAPAGSIIGVFEPRYPQAENISSTSSTF